MNRRRPLALYLVPVVATGLVAAGLVVAKPQPKKIEPAVVPGTALCTKTAPSGKAWVTILTQGENAFLARLELAAGASVPEHRDATEEYIHVLQGSGTMHIDGEAYEVGPGSTVLMPAHALVSFQNGKEHLVAMQVFAGPEPAKKYASWKGCE